jgi:MFS family permease
VPFAFSALAHGGVIVPNVNLVLSLICHDYLKTQNNADGGFQASFSFDPGPECRIAEVQSRTATFKLAVSVITGSIAAISAPKLGALSDQYGRTKMLALVNCGMILSEIITVLAAKFHSSVSVNWMLAGAVFDGMTGSFIASMAISESYVSDVTSPNRRNVVFGWFHGCLFTGIAIGPVLAGYIIKRTGSVIKLFYLATGCHITFFLLLILAVPESVPKSRQMTARQKHRERNGGMKPQSLLHHMANFKFLEPLKIIYGPNASPLIRKNLILLATLDTIVFGVGMGAAQVVLLYSNFMFGWDQWHQAKFTTIANSWRVTCLLVVLPALTTYLRSRQHNRQHDRQRPSHLSIRDPELPEGTDAVELTIIRFAVFMDTLGFCGYALASAGPQFLLSGAIASTGGIGPPSLQAALTKHVPKEDVGRLLGASSSLHALARVFGPIVFTGIYAQTVGFFPQAYFWALTIMFGFAFAFSWRIQPAGKMEYLDFGGHDN